MRIPEQLLPQKDQKEVRKNFLQVDTVLILRDESFLLLIGDRCKRIDRIQNGESDQNEKRKRVYGGIFMFSQLLQYLGVVAGERFGDLGGKFRFSSEEGREGVREGFSYFRCRYFVFCHSGAQQAYEWREKESSEIRQDQEVFRGEQGKDQ